MSIEKTIDEWFSNPDFAGVEIRSYVYEGDERLESKDPRLLPRSFGRDTVAIALMRSHQSAGALKVRPLFYQAN